jgi:AraC-like DNA-binding protein
MNQVETIMAVQRMQEYIDAHLCEKITLKQLADAAGYSSWHAARIFKENTGRTPAEASDQLYALLPAVPL